MMELPVIHSEDERDAYGFARVPESIDRVQYGRFRNVYLYITDKCQLRCGHCYMGDRLEVASVMATPEVERNMTVWRRMGGSKLSVLGGEPTLHPDFEHIIGYANGLGYEKVILNTNGLGPARRKLGHMVSSDFAYVQVSVDGGSPNSHDQIRGNGTFEQAWQSIRDLCSRGFDTRIICTVNRLNIGDCTQLLSLADEVGVSLVKYHVFSGIGLGTRNAEWLIEPDEWIRFYESLDRFRDTCRAQIWYQPTYARVERMGQYGREGFRGCVGRTLDRISIFADGRAYVCSYLFDTALNYATSLGGEICLNKGDNEADLFAAPLAHASCGSCKAPSTCVGGCPAERIVMGSPSCMAPGIVPVCRLWKSRV